MCWGQSLCEMLVQYSPHTPWGYQTGPGRAGSIDIFTPDPPLVLPPSYLIRAAITPPSSCPPLSAQARRPREVKATQRKAQFLLPLVCTARTL